MVDFNIPDPNKPEQNLSYHIDKRLLKFLESIKAKIQHKDKDYVMLVDGYEGSGKSTFSMQVGKYVDDSLDLSRVCMTADEFKAAILSAGKAQCVIYDEAVTGMTSADSISRIGKLLKSLMMQMRQKNLFVIIILPTLFDLNRYAVLSRARSFFHIYENKGKMGYFAGYNKKDTRLLYIKGKKTYAYRVRGRFIGRFYGKYVVNEEEYRKKKMDALALVEEVEKKGKAEWLEQGCIMIWMAKGAGISTKIIEYWLKRGNVPLSKTEINDRNREIERKFGKWTPNAETNI